MRDHLCLENLTYSTSSRSENENVRFKKNTFFSIIFTFIDDFTLIVIITNKFEVLDFAGLCWPSLAFLAFVALDNFFKQKLAFADKN